MWRKFILTVVWLSRVPFSQVDSKNTEQNWIRCRKSTQFGKGRSLRAFKVADKAGVAKVAVIVEETGPFGTRTRGEVSLRKNASH